MKNKIVVGLTGGIASGKSAVLKEFKRLGAKTLDCDRIARAAARPGLPAFKKIISYFGRSVLKKNGSLDRKKLGTIVFNNVKKRRALERMVHPEVIKTLEKRIGNFRSGLIVIDIPLLFEAGLQNMVDKSIVVWVPEKTQSFRLMKRDKITPNEATAKIRAQWPISRKIKHADFTVDNSGPARRTKRGVFRLFKILKKGLAPSLK